MLTINTLIISNRLLLHRYYSTLNCSPFILTQRKTIKNRNIFSAISGIFFLETWRFHCVQHIKIENIKCPIRIIARMTKSAFSSSWYIQVTAIERCNKICNYYQEYDAVQKTSENVQLLPKNLFRFNRKRFLSNSCQRFLNNIIFLLIL